jgi:pseudouridine kinase
MRIAVAGSAILDVVARPTSRVERATSNEGDVTIGAGGTGRNVAENLARLGGRVTLVTDLADDFAGRFLLENIRGLGIEARLSARGRTGVYLALLTPHGDLDRSFCGTGTECVAADEVLAALPDLAEFNGVVIDANLAEPAVAALAERCRRLEVPFAVETVARGRARRALPAISGCALVKPDRAEATTLTGLPCGTRAEAAACARRLRAMGAGSVIVSLDADGCHVEHPAFSGHIDAVPAEVADVTGAGDAMLAAAFAALLKGLPPRLAAEAGRRAAALTVASLTAVSPSVTPVLLDENWLKESIAGGCA